ncbi:conjugative transposon protein TraK [Paraflavisolibacter sp. H34]|uniref:conjugative transposon protein TraK n=1 Tax=Huijunlia imazamoxiresistens TaxID=3127457 RepID=UPI003015B44C
MIRDIEQKVQLAKLVSLGSFASAIILVIVSYLFFFSLIRQERKKIYVIDNGVPLLARQTDVMENRPVEYRANVERFHSLFFTLAADNEFIQNQMKKAMYLVDESGVAQYNNLKESGYLNNIISSSAVLTLSTDSIVLDGGGHHFTYYGKQRIERPSNLVIRALVTEGFLEDVPRTENNPHGVLIRNWKTLKNKDLDHVEKNNF